MNNKIKIFLLFIFSPATIFCEHPDTTMSRINNNRFYINEACSLFNVDMSILCSIIFVECRENYSWEDNAMDEYLAQVGLNSSIGFCQIKIKTAYWIESQLKDSNSIQFPGKRYNNLFSVSISTQEIINKLQNDSLNIMYAAAYLRIMISRWEKENFSISERPDILGTLYSTGLFYRDGTERRPNNNPKSNNFGKMVNDSMIFFRSQRE